MWKKRALAVAGAAARRIPLDQTQLFSFIASPAVRAEPWDVYRRLHARGPVRPGPKDSWLVGSHAGVSAVLRSPTSSVDESLSTAAAGLDRSGVFTQMADRMLLMTDPPEHQRLRRAVSRSFTPGRIDALAPVVESRAESLLSEIRSRGRADLVSTFALPFPVAVIAELLGLPPEDQPQFRRWALDLAPRMDISLFRDEEIEQRGDLAATEIQAYFTEVIEDRSRRDPDGLVAALADQTEDRLTTEEIIPLCVLLLLAGFETTANLIATSVDLLVRTPDQLAVLRSEQVDHATAIEELLRVAGPVQFTQRTLLEDTEIEGHLIPARTLAALLIGAANRDPLVFDDPDRLDLTRDPNPHLAFSFGIHHCLGAALARLEARVAIPLIFEMLPSLELDGVPRRKETFVLRGLYDLPVRWSA